MPKVLRPVCLLIAILILFCALPGCGSTGMTSATTSSQSSQTAGQTTASTQASKWPDYLNMSSEFPIVKDGEKVKLTAMITQHDGMGPSDPEKYWFIAWAQKKMNIDLEVELVQYSALEEKKAMMFAGGTLPDLIWCMSLSTSELVNYGQKSKMLLDMKSYISDELTPNINKWFTGYPDAKASVMCSDGSIFTLPGIGDVSDIGDIAARFFINKTWLGKAGIKMPETIDDLTAMLRAFKKIDPNSIPLGGTYIKEAEANPGVVLLSGLGFVTTDPFGIEPALKKNEVVIPGADPLYKEYLKLMKTYYDEGLISEDFFTIDKTEYEAMAAEGQFGAMPTVAYLTNPDSFKEWEATYPLTSAFNDKKQWPVNSRYQIGQYAVASTCKYPEAAMRFADFFFSDLGNVYKWSGPMEGTEDTLGMVDGWFVKKDGDSMIFNVKDVVDKKYDNRWVYYVSAIIPSGAICSLGNCTLSGFDDQETGYGSNFVFAGYDYARPLSLEDGDGNYRYSQMQNEADYIVPVYPRFTYFSEEQNLRITDLKTVIDSYIMAETAKFITGVRPIDDFDKYLAELKALGVPEYLGYYADFYQKYTAAMK